MSFPGLDVFPQTDRFPGLDSFPGASYVFYFNSPTQDVPYRIEGNLFGLEPFGLNVWRQDGVWHSDLSITAEQVAAADRFYPGGHVHELTPTQRDELTAAGFGAYITYKEIL